MDFQPHAGGAAARAAVIACGTLIAVVSMLQPACLRGQENNAPAPLVLNMRDAVRMALAPQGNPEIGVAEESVKIAEDQLREARGLAYPEIYGTVSGQNQVLNLAAYGFDEIHLPIPGYSFPNSVGPFNTVTAQVHVRQGLFDMSFLRRTRALQAGVTAAKDQTDEARDQIATQVAKLYLAAVKVSSAIDLAKARLESAETTLRVLTNRNAEGKALGIDVSRAQAHVASEKQLLMQAQVDQARANLDLLNALNVDLDRPLNLTEPLAFTPQDILSPEQMVAIALKSRSEIVSQKQRIDAARLSNKSVQSERLPSLVGHADMGSSGTTLGNSVGTYNVGVSLIVPVFDGGRLASREASGAASLRQDELREKQLEKRVELEVRQALLQLSLAKGQVEASSKEFEIAKDELNHRHRLAEQGIAGETEEADARLALAQADDNRLAALYAWNEARIELMQSMGTIRNLAQ
ncbi:MAG TPA: TolC family protein [Terracidiphilus sp.]|nr:TolC family protein [Terracidiphilus sp.]